MLLFNNNSNNNINSNYNHINNNYNNKNNNYNKIITILIITNINNDNS